MEYHKNRYLRLIIWRSLVQAQAGPHERSTYENSQVLFFMSAQTMRKQTIPVSTFQLQTTTRRHEDDDKASDYQIISTMKRYYRI